MSNALWRLARGRGQAERAIGHLQPAADLARQLSLPAELWPIEAELSELHQALGAMPEAGQAAARAAGVVHALADNLGDERLRSGFLSAPAVKKILHQEGAQKG